MTDVQDAATLDNLRQASRYLLQAARARHVAERNQCRPSVQLRPELEGVFDPTHGGLYWQASYGGLIVNGETPEAAFQEFDLAWLGQAND